MNIHCDVIRDLLPLYAEDLTSQATRDLVQRHLEGCAECARQFGILKKVQLIPLDTDPGGLKKVKKLLTIRRIVAVATALLMVLSLCLCAAMLLNAQIYLTADQAVESVEALEDGSLRIRWKDIGITAVAMLGNPVDGDQGNVGIICRTSLRNLLFPMPVSSYESLPDEAKVLIGQEDWNAKTIQLEGGAANRNLWFCCARDGAGETLIWDAGKPYPQAHFSNVNYHIAWYLVILLGMMFLFAFLSGRGIKRKVTRAAATAFGCVAFCVVIVTAGQFAELFEEFTQCVVNSCVTAIPVFGAMMCIWQLRDWRKMDQGE